MFSWFKKRSDPTYEAHSRPRILRGRVFQGIIIFIIFCSVVTPFSPLLSQAYSGQQSVLLPDVISELTNNERKSQNLKALTINPILNTSAQSKAVDMATKSYFAHTSPEGKSPWFWLDKVGYKYQYAGENLAVNFTKSEDVVRAWMESSTHRANIVKENYTEIGTGVATGLYEGKETTFVVQVYGNPLPNKNIKNPPKQSKTPIKIKTRSIKKESTQVLGAEAIKLISYEPAICRKSLVS